MFDDRFARQNRYGLPPEFPLASAYTSIDHHLSGLSLCALASPRLKRVGRAGDALQIPFNKNPQISPQSPKGNLYFHFAFEFRKTH
jgi:hypothetical protein